MSDNEEDKVAVMQSAKRKGKVYPYNLGDNVNTYIKGVELYFALNKTPEDDKALEVLTRVGQTPMDRIISTFKPACVTTKSYDQLKEKFKSLYESHVNQFSMRYRKVTRKQTEGESLDDFAIELSNLAEQMGTSEETANVLMQSVFVAGIKSQKTREAMLRDATTKDSIDDLLEKAKNLEETARESQFMERSENSLNVMRYRREQESKSGNSQIQASQRTRYNSSTGALSNYRENQSTSAMSGIQCYNCNKFGRFKRNCTQPRILKQKWEGMKNYKRTPNWKQKVNSLAQAIGKMTTFDENTDEGKEKEEMSTDDEVAGYFNNILLGEFKNIKPAFVELRVNEEKILKEIDTGACASVCSGEFHKIHFEKCKLLPCNKRSTC